MQTSTSRHHFLPKKAKIAVILNLCMVFTTLLWYAGQPFMGDLFTYKSYSMLYQAVMGSPELLHKLDPSRAQELDGKLQRNRARFELLPQKQQASLRASYESLQEKANAPFHVKLKASCNLLAFEIPVFEKSWLILSLVLSILILLGIDGSREAAWLLPLITLAYISQNWLQGTIDQPPDVALYPTENVIVSNYLKEPLNSDILIQREQLLKGWQLFLIREYTGQIPSQDPALFLEQVEQGEFAFHLARLELVNPSRVLNHHIQFQHKKPGLILACYFGWNLFLALIVFQRRRVEVQPAF